MTELWAFLPAEHAALINTTLDATANTTHHPGGDDRTADQRRADALTDLARHALDRSDDTGAATGAATGANAGSDGDGDGGGGGGVGDAGWMSPTATDLAPPGSTETAAGGFRLARAHGQRPAIHVTIAASTLMGLDDQPGDLDGYGPITAAMARRIAADPTATWRRLLTDNRGHVLHAATTGYRPTAAIIATVLARDQHCAFPGGRRPARHNDLDHVTAWRHGDHTTTDSNTPGPGPSNATTPPAPSPGPTTANAPTTANPPPCPPPPPPAQQHQSRSQAPEQAQTPAPARRRPTRRPTPATRTCHRPGPGMEEGRFGRADQTQLRAAWFAYGLRGRQRTAPTTCTLRARTFHRETSRPAGLRACDLETCRAAIRIAGSA